MAEKPSYEDLEQRVQELEKEVFELKQVRQALGGSAENIYSFLAPNGDPWYQARLFVKTTSEPEDKRFTSDFTVDNYEKGRISWASPRTKSCFSFG